MARNVLLVVVDDLGYNDLGFRNGGQVHTPTLDALARSGVEFTNAYVESVCSPSRASLLTGAYPLHHGVTDWLEPGVATGLPTNLTTLADALRARVLAARRRAARAAAPDAEVARWVRSQAWWW